MKQKSKYERPTESGDNKPWTKINPKAQEKYPEVSEVLHRCQCRIKVARGL